MNQRPLTVVIPILIHQGKRKFVKRPFYHYFKDLPEELRSFIPDFDFFLTSSEAVDDEKLFGMDEGSMLRSLFLTYKHIEDSRYVEERFQEFFKFYQKNPEMEKLFILFYEYFLKNSELSIEILQKKVQEFLSSNLKDNTMSTYQKILEKGKEEAKEEAEKKLKAVAKRFWLKGNTVVFLAEMLDIPIETMKKWFLVFEKEEADKKK